MFVLIDEVQQAAVILDRDGHDLLPVFIHPAFGRLPQLVGLCPEFGFRFTSALGICERGIERFHQDGVFACAELGEA